MKKNNKLILVLLIVLNVFFLNIDLAFAVTGDTGGSTTVKIFNSGKASYTDLSYCADWSEKVAGDDVKYDHAMGAGSRYEAEENAKKDLANKVAALEKQGFVIKSTGIPNCSRDKNQIAVMNARDIVTDIPVKLSASTNEEYKIQRLKKGDVPSSFTCTITITYASAQYKSHTSVKNLPAVEYNSSSPDFANISERAYCLQQGRNGPSNTSMTYKALEDFDLSNCTGSSSYSYQCGLASILLDSANISYDANGNISKSDAGFTYASVSSALRSYVAYYHKYVNGSGGLKDSDGSVSSNVSSAEADAFDYYSGTDVYDKSMEYYLNGGAPLSCSSACSNKGVFCYSNDTQKKNIEDFQKLLQNAVNFAQNPQNSSLADFINQLQSNTEASGDVSVGNKVDVDYDFDKNAKNVTVELEFKEMFIGSTLVTKNTPITVPVKYCNELSDGCNVVITTTDRYGRVLPNDVPNGCDKNYCKIKVDYSQICNQTDTTKTDNYLVIHIYAVPGVKNSTGPNAFIKNYVTASGGIAQQFVGFDINGWQTNGKTPGSVEERPDLIIKKEDLKEIVTKTTTVVCPCDKQNRCDDFEVKNTLPGYCSNYGQFNQGIYDTYDKGTVEEPYMNCIMNACDVSERNQYDFSEEYGVNTKVCRVFCREEVEFYMANKTRVYAGMQFKYKIDEVLGNKRKLTNGHSLTSMVLQKRQCATEIYYDHVNPLYNYGNTQTWQEKYKEALENLMEAWNTWKEWEAVHKQAKWACLIPEIDGKISKGGTCTKKGSTCGASCVNISPPLVDVKYLYSWPIARGEPGGQYFKNYGDPTITINKVSGSNNIKANLHPKIVPGGHSNGTPNTFSTCRGGGSCCSGYSYPCDSDGDGKKDETCCSLSDKVESGTCKQGVGGDECEVKTFESTASGNFKKALDKITQLVYDLQNCNLYTTNELDIKYNAFTYQGFAMGYSGDYNKATSKGTTKDYILSLANCESEESCIGLEISYDDARYGAATIFGKEVEIVKQEDDIKKQEDTTYYCVNSESGEKSSGDSYKASCYPGPGKTDVDLTGGNQKNVHQWIACKGFQKGVDCQVKDAQWPINDFAIFTVVSEADFWQPKEYSTEAYTGIVSEGAGSGNSLSLDKYVFPVSMDTESGSTKAYDIKHRYTNVGSALSKAKLLNHNYYEFTCQYEVYNITNLYDCELEVDENGNVDLSDACNNLCYEIENGVPIIREEGQCAHWSPKNTDSKGYGFIYRNVELGNLFPAERPIGNNWLENSDIKDAIEATASDMYSNGDKYLQYSFILNSDAIKKIKEYNKNKNVRGGYIDNSYDQCYVVPISGSTGGFYECTTSFMNEIRTNSNNFGVQVIKSDGVKGGGY